MSTIDIAYLATVLFSFTGFAGVLAYYSQTCAEPNRRRSEGAVQRTRLATSH